VNRLADNKRRWWGLFCLIMAIGLLAWGQTLLKPHLVGLVYLVYWLSCFAFVAFAILIALFDLWVVNLRRQSGRPEIVEKIIKEHKPNEPVAPKDADEKS
jgi:hypothetical protein